METISMRPQQQDEAQMEVAGTERARRASGVPVTSICANAGHTVDRPDPEVAAQKPRRRFTAAYKLRALKLADQCTEPGQIGALLRKEGLYSSHLTCWRKQRDQGVLNGLTPAKRGRKAKPKSPLDKRVAELERENQRLEIKLKQARIIIEAQKKISQILEIQQNLEDSR